MHFFAVRAYINWSTLKATQKQHHQVN